MMKIFLFFLISFSVFAQPEIVDFKSGELKLKGELFLPKGKGPFPAVLYNHGSAAGMLSSEVSKKIGPMFVAKGWVFFMPYRRGQGLSAQAGKYIGDEIAKVEKAGTEKAEAELLVKLMIGEQLDDQMAALKWLRDQSFVQADKIAVAGNSFGGIQAVLGVEKESYCAAVSASGGAESWSKATELQEVMKNAVKNAKAAILFFQAENDYDLAPSKILSEYMKAAGKIAEMKIYPPFGKTAKEGHSFAYLGSYKWFDDVLVFLNKNCLHPKILTK